jgi:hypothetical protein
MVHASAVSLLLTPLKEVADGYKHAAVTAENYDLSQWPEAEEPPTKPFGQTLATQFCRNSLDIYEKALIQEAFEFFEGG